MFLSNLKIKRHSCFIWITGQMLFWLAGMDVFALQAEDRYRADGIDHEYSYCLNIESTFLSDSTDSKQPGPDIISRDFTNISPYSNSVVLDPGLTGPVIPETPYYLYLLKRPPPTVH